ncbi:AlpA family phage regulatory protein [Comamonas thiooxydans]|uniref:AlpA family phage regulatory protein n=1 Tax=Comamonas thiooxydans TaxID=363952 RepID=A0AA42QAD8_9BURK|nr:AlpA family phage regulatory protein [Comamonas thiooxydans]MDH1337628.1 AlpA family phage regulatory protein [Comamonas thiooxydans]MDH1743828.1 AlpA family phage regulatory protein [Comamonas thiooxydans]MDH1790134.1 AlpA family phage regulatory protein [Comamonas thiooxydans]
MMRSRQVIRIEEVLNITGLSRSMIYKLMAQERFPRPIALGDRAVGWYEEDVIRWINGRRDGVDLQVVKLPSIYLAGRMGSPEDNKQPGAENSCWRLFDVSESAKLGTLEVDNEEHEVLIAPLEQMKFVGTNTSFMYSGPWKARGSYHGYIHGTTSCSPSTSQEAAYLGAIQGISRADVVVAFLEDHEAFGTLAEIGYAKGIGKRVVVITSPKLAGYSDGFGTELWFSIRMADRHVALSAPPSAKNQDIWRKAHKAAGAVISEWYPPSS